MPLELPSDAATSRGRVSRWSWGALALLVASVLWLVFRPDPAPDEGTWQRIERTGVARIGYANEAPYGYLNTETGEITGEAPEIARAILRRMGVRRIEPVVTEFGSMIPGLKAGRFDLIAAGMYITPARCEEIAFSDPTYKIGEGFIVRRGNPLDLHSFEDVAAHPSARLGFVGGTVEQGYAEAVGIPRERIVLFPDTISALAGVLSGRVDAAAATSLTAHDLLRKADSDRLEMAEPFSNPVIDGEVVYGYGAFGFRKQDRRFREEFNEQLRRFLGTEEHLRLVRPFGVTADKLPEGKTAAELCQPNEASGGR